MSINNKRSYTEYTVTQPTTDFAIGFDDFDGGSKDNILVTLNGVLVETLGYAAIRKNESTVTITPAITEGTVRLTRETDIDEPFHKFTAGALFSAKSMDENFQQVRHSQQEVRDGFEYLAFNTNGIVQGAKDATARANEAADAVAGLVVGEVRAQDVSTSAGRTQADKNAEHVTIADFGGDFVKAGNWVKQSISNYCYLEAGKDYTINGTGTVYFNRMIAQGGRANVTVPSGVSLEFMAKTDGSEVFHLENINFNILGGRLGIGSGNLKYVYNMQFVNTVAKVKLSGLTVKALTAIGNPNSWSDDAGKTRHAGFAYVNLAGDSYIKDIEHYGFGVFYAINNTSTKSTHHEENVKGFNNQTGVFLVGNDFTYGTTKDISVLNTKEQQKYWINQIAEPNPNGKDVVMSEVSHSVSWVVDNINGQGMSERALYSQSDNLRASNIYEVGNWSGSNFKPKPAISGVAKGQVTGLTYKYVDGYTTSGAVLALYNYKSFYLNNVNISAPTPTSLIAMTMLSGGDYYLNGWSVKNTGAVMLYEVSTGDIDSINCNNMTLMNCGMALVPSSATQTYKVKRLNLNNITAIKGATAVINGTGLQLTNITKAVVDTVSVNSNEKGFASTGCTELHIKNSNFNIYSTTETAYKLWNQWSFANADFAAYREALTANTFNFWLNFEQTADPLGVAVRINMRKLKDTGKTYCGDFWQRVEIDYTVNPSGVTTTPLFHTINKSCEVSVSFAQSQMKFVYDAVAKTMTPIYNVGTDIKNVLTSNKVNVFINSTGDLVVNIGNGTWTGGGGVIFISLNRI